MGKGDVDANILTGHKPREMNTHSENKTDSPEEKEEEEEGKRVRKGGRGQGGRDRGKKNPLFVKPEAEQGCGRQCQAHGGLISPPWCHVAGRGRKDVRG